MGPSIIGTLTVVLESWGVSHVISVWPLGRDVGLRIGFNCMANHTYLMKPQQKLGMLKLRTAIPGQQYLHIVIYHHTKGNTT